MKNTLRTFFWRASSKARTRFWPPPSKARTRFWRAPSKARSCSLIVVGLLAISAPLFAHHGNASYDATKSVNVKGTVTDFIWANPHCFVKVDVKDDSGNVVHWVVESQNPVSMSQIGWSKDTFKRGDEVEIDAIPAKNGNPIGFLGSASPTAPRRRIVINGKLFQGPQE